MNEENRQQAANVKEQTGDSANNEVGGDGSCLGYGESQEQRTAAMFAGGYD